jgi:hypothetical protein
MMLLTLVGYYHYINEAIAKITVHADLVTIHAFIGDKTLTLSRPTASSRNSGVELCSLVLGYCDSCSRKSVGGIADRPDYTTVLRMAILDYGHFARLYDPFRFAG